MGSIERSFQILGIEPTKEIREIKKAYSKMVKQCHPEENPQQWEQLHDAYTTATAYAKGERVSNILTEYGQTRYENTLSQKNVQKAEKPKSEEREQLREEIRSEGRKEPKEEPKSEEREQPREEIKSEEIPKQEKDELEELFYEIENQSSEKKQELEKAYREKLAVLKQCPRKTAFETWKAFFEDPDFIFYCQEDAFWSSFLYILRKSETNGETNNYIWKTLDLLEEYLLSCMKLEQVSKVREAKQICEKKKQYITLPIGRMKVKKRNFCFGILAVIVCCGLIISLKDVMKSSKTYAKEQLVEYLNKKYEDTTYEKDDFEIEKIKSKEGLISKGTMDIYEAKLKGDEEKEAYIWLYRSKGNTKKEALCLDNFQQEEIQNSLWEQLVVACGMDAGMLHLVSAEPQDLKSGADGKPAVYHTKYDGNLEAFFEEESKTRKPWVEKGRENFVSLSENFGNKINGTYIFWFPDKEITDVRQWLEQPQDGANQEVCQRIQNLEESYNIQVVAAAMPQSCYQEIEQTLAQKGNSDQAVVKEGMGNIESAQGLPFATMWYQTKTEDQVLKIQSEMQQDQVQKVLNETDRKLGAGEIEKIGETQESQNTENQNTEDQRTESQGMYLRKPEQVEEGIYFIETKGDSALPIQVSGERQKNEISITCAGGEDSKYVLILDKKKLGIEENNYHIMRQENKNGYEPVRYKKYPYTSWDGEMDAVWQEKDFLFLTGYNNDRISSTYTIVLEP